MSSILDPEVMAKKQKEPTFEEALQELEDITRSLESGSLTLDESIQSYEKGMELRKICMKMLEKAEKKLEYLEKQEDETLVKRPIEEADEGDLQDGLF